MGLIQEILYLPEPPVRMSPDEGDVTWILEVTGEADGVGVTAGYGTLPQLALCMELLVRGPAEPVAEILFAVWKDFTAATVAGP
jgi:hypothetical protein